tara:strand:- start:547 stop:1494 length:948 start_codon:yes stop_codon:yes gene_type:complete
MEISKWARFVKESGRPVVASISGGKDSTAMALYLIHNLEIRKTNPLYFVMADTGWEHGDLTKYVNEVLRPLFGEIAIVRSEKYPGGMPDLVRKKAFFPSRRFRFCTIELKIKPQESFVKQIAKKHGKPPINAVGIRAHESVARSRFEEWDDDSPFKVEGLSTWRPLITWRVADVVAIHAEHNLRPAPLYLKDKNPAKRVGCWPCIMSRKDEIRAVAEDTPERIKLIRDLERDVEELVQIRRQKNDEEVQADKQMPKFFLAKDNKGYWDIDKVVKWSKTSRGGKQYQLFTPESESDRGCQMWGLCDIPNEDGEFTP